MNELYTRCLDTFPEWLRSLATDATDLAALLEGDALDKPAKLHVAGALNYLFKSLDLIPDGIEDLGFLDDAFILRLGAKHAVDELGSASAPEALTRLAGDTAIIAELLEGTHARLVAYAKNLVTGAARGRTTQEIVEDEASRAAFLTEVRGWAASYQAPSFARDEKNIVKLSSFLSAKLPA
ncbi:MAG: YkvA family protein [Polyangiaceae bacterium]